MEILLGIAILLLSVLIIGGFLFWKNSKNLRELNDGSIDTPTMTSTIVQTMQTDVSTELDRRIDYPAEFVIDSNIPGMDKLTFSRISFPELKKMNRNIQMMNLNNPLNTVPAIAANSMAIAGAQGLFRASVDASRLTLFANGTVSTMIHGSQGIARANAGFISVNPIEVFTPLIIFQVASIVTGQYYLQGITKQLTAISKRLEYLIHLHHNEKIAILTSSYEILENIASQKNFTIEDINELRAIYKDATSIKHEYSRLLNEIDSSKYYQETKKYIKEAKRMAQLDQLVSEDMLTVYYSILLCAERVLFLAKLLELKCNIALCQYEPTRTNEIIDIVSSITKYVNYIENVNYYNELEQIFNEIKKITISSQKIGWGEKGKKPGRTTMQKYKKILKDCKDDLSILIDETSSTGEDITQKMTKQRDLLFIIDKDGNQHCAELLPS